MTSSLIPIITPSAVALAYVVLTPKGGPPALPGWQQKFDVCGGRPLMKLAMVRHEAPGQILYDNDPRYPGRKVEVVRVEGSFAMQMRPAADADTARLHL